MTIETLREGVQAKWWDLEPEEPVGGFDASLFREIRAYAYGVAEAKAYYDAHANWLNQEAQAVFRPFIAGELIADCPESQVLLDTFAPGLSEELVLYGSETGPPERLIMHVLWARTHQNCVVPDRWNDRAKQASRAFRAFRASVETCPRTPYEGNPDMLAVRLTTTCVWPSPGVVLRVFEAELLPPARRLAKRAHAFTLLGSAEAVDVLDEHWPGWQSKIEGKESCI